MSYTTQHNNNTETSTTRNSAPVAAQPSATVTPPKPNGTPAPVGDQRFRLTRPVPTRSANPSAPLKSDPPVPAAKIIESAAVQPLPGLPARNNTGVNAAEQTKAPFTKTPTPIQLLPVSALEIDSKFQLRECLDEEVVKSYRDLLKDGHEFPPLQVFEIDGKLNVADGFHRLAAHRLAGRDTIRVLLREGGPVEAWQCAIDANSGHGLPFNNRDKRRVLAKALEIHPDWSERQIANFCRVSHTMVSNFKRELAGRGNACQGDAENESISPVNDPLKETQSPQAGKHGGDVASRESAHVPKDRVVAVADENADESEVICLTHDEPRSKDSKWTQIKELILKTASSLSAEEATEFATWLNQLVRDLVAANGKVQKTK